LFVLSLLGLTLLSIFVPVAGYLLGAEIFLYLSIMILAGVYAAVRQGKPYLVFGLPLAISVMHLVWGTGFLGSIVHLSMKNKYG
jgi:hypothetical protein